MPHATCHMPRRLHEEIKNIRRIGVRKITAPDTLFSYILVHYHMLKYMFVGRDIVLIKQ
jgi:hypothetical protein